MQAVAKSRFVSRNNNRIQAYPRPAIAQPRKPREAPQEPELHSSLQFLWNKFRNIEERLSSFFIAAYQRIEKTIEKKFSAREKEFAERTGVSSDELLKRDLAISDLQRRVDRIEAGKLAEVKSEKKTESSEEFNFGACLREINPKPNSNETFDYFCIRLRSHIKTVYSSNISRTKNNSITNIISNVLMPNNPLPIDHKSKLKKDISIGELLQTDNLNKAKASFKTENQKGKALFEQMVSYFQELNLGAAKKA